MAVTALAGRIKVLRRISERMRNPRGLLESIGRLLVSHSQRSFADKRLGEFIWPTRYPNMRIPPPFLNKAAAISDLIAGRKVKARRYDREPVLQGDGTLLRGINYRVLDLQTVEIGVHGPARQYAGLHQKGGVSVQKITQTARHSLAEQLKALRRARRAPKRESKKKTEEQKQRSLERRSQAEQRLAALSRLGFIFQTDVVETKINRRPFLGVTPRAQREIRGLVQRFFSGEDFR